MDKISAKIGIFGGREEDLSLLSELHKQDFIEILFLYESLDDAIGIEIAEILGIGHYTRPEQLAAVTGLDYLVITEPRERFEEAIAAVTIEGVKLLSAGEALGTLCRVEERVASAEPEESAHYSIEDTLAALEKLFDRKALLKFLLDLAVKHAQASSGSIMLYSHQSEELYIGYATGLSERIIKNTRQRLGQGVAGRVALEKRAQLIRLRQGDALYERDRERIDIATAISVPLLWDNRLLGVLNVSTTNSERELDNGDFERLKKISRRISKVLAGSLKVQEIQLRHQEQHIHTTIGELTEKPAAFQEKIFTLSNYLSELLGIDTVEIYLNTHEGDWFLLGGSNSRFAAETQKVRCEKGVLSRCFLEQRPIILRESSEGREHLTDAQSALVFYPLNLLKPLGVLVTEFSERHKLEEFLIAKESIGLEIARFISSEIRSRALQRELDTLGKVSEAAPGLLNSRSVADICDALSRTIARLFDCDYVSTRLKTRTPEQGFIHAAFTAPTVSAGAAWQDEDEMVFRKLSKKREPFSEAHLSFEPAASRRVIPYDSLLAVPVIKGDELIGGITAYNKHATDPLEEAIFSDFDRTVINQLLAFALPVLDTVSSEQRAPEDDTEASYEKLLKDNRDRLLKMCDREIQRSDRYHYPFTFLLFRLSSLTELFTSDYQHALELVEEITHGIRTRTRKTDYLSWIAKDTFALLSLEGSRRVRFLVSRILLYLEKDLTAFAARERADTDILLGQAAYPGGAGTAEELLQEAERNLMPHAEE